MIDTRVPFYEARRRLVEPWERRYLEALLREHEGKIDKVARAAGVSRTYLYQILSRLSIPLR